MILPYDVLYFICYRFLNFLLPHPAKPISPVPGKSIVDGSGTGAGSKSEKKLS
jgi:hypothetical protein